MAHEAIALDPRDSPGPFADLMAEIRDCKDARTCPSLRSRAYYFEPNADTIGEWHRDGLYLDELDRRVMFVCESPGPFVMTENDSSTIRCYAWTPQDRRFRAAREHFGFQHCYLTNSVKCGVRNGSSHTNAEIQACRAFLAQEIELVRPLVAVGVGNNAYRTLRRQVLPLLDSPPVLFQITHYSARGKVWDRWEAEFPELQRLLDRLCPRDQW